MADPFYIAPGLSVYSAYAPPWPVAVVNLDDPPHQLDLQDGGLYQISGTVDELGQLGAYRVRLFDRVSGRLLREQFSDASGNYSFQYLANRPLGYILIAHDHGDDPLNAAIADLVSPEPMP